MSLLEKKINESVNKLINPDDPINEIVKAYLKGDKDELEYTISKIKEANKKDAELILKEFTFTNIDFEKNNNLEYDNIDGFQKTTSKSEPVESIKTRIYEGEETR